MTKRRKKARSDDEYVRPTPVDGHVGSRIRARRLILGMSQQKLAAALGISFQQLQKNERGSNRIACSRLVDLSKALDVPVQFFFDEMPTAIQKIARGERFKPLSTENVDLNQMATAETLKLVRAYYAIKSPRVRKQVMELARALDGDSA